MDSFISIFWPIYHIFIDEHGNTWTKKKIFKITDNEYMEKELL